MKSPVLKEKLYLHTHKWHILVDSSIHSCTNLVLCFKVMAISAVILHFSSSLTANYIRMQFLLMISTTYITMHAQIFFDSVTR